MKSGIIIAAAAMLLTAGAAQAERDPFVGEWAYYEKCAGETQCWLEIDKQGDVYKVDYVVAAWTDAKDEKCRVSSEWSRGAIRYDIHNDHEDGLSGPLLEGYAFLHNETSDGSLYLGGGLGSGFLCGEYLPQGNYEMIGW